MPQLFMEISGGSDACHQLHKTPLRTKPLSPDPCTQQVIKDLFHLLHAADRTGPWLSRQNCKHLQKLGYYWSLTSWGCKIRIKGGAFQSSSTSALHPHSKAQLGAEKTLLSCYLISVSLVPPRGTLGCWISSFLFLLSQTMVRVGVSKYRAA